MQSSLNEKSLEAEVKSQYKRAEDSPCAFCSPEICPLQKGLWGCGAKCGITCEPANCQWTCPNRPEEFAWRWREVGGFKAPPLPALLAPIFQPLPRYIPLIQHSYKFKSPLPMSVAAINTFEVLKLRQDGYGSRAFTSEELLAEWKLGPRTELLLISVAKDRHLENYWRYRKADRVPDRLAELGIRGITIPNFSYFFDAPPWHTLWNQRRLLKVADELSQVGVGVIPHLNALSSGNWKVWQNLLSEQTHLKLVAKEFQTGARRSATVGRRSLDDLIRLQDAIGRPLHPIVIGGGRYWPQLTRSFTDFTVIDSTPFMKSINRHRIIASQNGSIRSEKAPLHKEEPIDMLWAENIKEYEEALRRRERVSPSRRIRPRPVHSGSILSGSRPQIPPAGYSLPPTGTLHL